MSITLGRGDQKYERRKEKNFAEIGKNINFKETSESWVWLYIRWKSERILSLAYCPLFFVK